MIRRPPRFHLFPYRQLFRSRDVGLAQRGLIAAVSIEGSLGVDIVPILFRDNVDTQAPFDRHRSEEHTSELQSRQYLVCRLLLAKKKDIASTAVTRQRVFILT